MMYLQHQFRRLGLVVAEKLTKDIHHIAHCVHGVVPNHHLPWTIDIDFFVGVGRDHRSRLHCHLRRHRTHHRGGEMSEPSLEPAPACIYCICQIGVGVRDLDNWIGTADTVVVRYRGRGIPAHPVISCRC